MTMPAGEYYVGDICYVLDDEWDEVGEITGWDADGEFFLKDSTMCAWHGTKYGDGTYLDQEGREYGVDSGTIGCVRLTNPKHKAKAQKIKSQGLGQIIRFGSSFRTSADGEGNISIGDVVVYTGPADDDYEEDDDE